MTDEAFSDTGLAALYDLLNPWAACDDFYLDLVMAAPSVLDVGCGTGTLLHRARREGHTGRLCGLDPAGAMLARARVRTDVTWVRADAAAADACGRFELVVMTGHAFQALVDDATLRASLAAIRAGLADGGRFAFETRNPLVRPWRAWTPENAAEVQDPSGAPIRVAHAVRTPVEGDRVHFTTAFTGPPGSTARTSSSTLRFLGTEALDGFLAEAGLAVEQRFGDWDRSPWTPDAPEIITVARRS